MVTPWPLELTPRGSTLDHSVKTGPTRLPFKEMIKHWAGKECTCRSTSLWTVAALTSPRRKRLLDFCFSKRKTKERVNLEKSMDARADQLLYGL